MKTKYKYFILIIITIITSILIYNYIEENTKVDTIPDILSIQNNAEKQILEDTNYTIDNPKVILNPYTISPLTALVVFKTNDLAPVTATIKGKDNDPDITNTFVPSKTHLISIYGLYPDYDNKVIINVSGEKKELIIKTDKLPDYLKEARVVNNVSDDFYFTTSSDINGTPVAYDKNGNIRWYLTKSYGWDFTRLSNGYLLLGDSDLMKDPYYSSGLVEMDLLGKIYFEYNLPGGYHHDVYEKTDGNLIAISNNINSNTKEDMIVEIDRNSGEVIKKFDLNSLLKNEEKDNWLSLNSVIYNPDTNSILAVGSKKDMIINIDYNSAEINWIIADESKVSDYLKKYLIKGSDIEFPIKPQALTLTGKNTFAHINNKDNENHLIEYEVNSSDRSFKEIKNTNLGKSAEHTNLEYNNYSFTIVQDNLIRQLDNNEITTIMETDHNLYSAKATKMYAGDIFMTGPSVRIGKTGITPTINDKPVIIHTKDESIFKKYNLILKHDAKRLMITGTFKKNDKVEVILDNVLSKKTYPVDMKNGKLNNNKILTTTYINKEGVYGKYYIYLKINGKNYKLSKYVVMG